MRNLVVDEPSDMIVDDVDVEDTTTSTDDVEISTENEFTVPDKFKGKSEADIAKAYVELEKELGRKANEVGELRKLTDEYLRRELTKSSPTPAPHNEEEIEEVDFFDDPKKVVNKAVENNPKVKALEEKLAKREQEDALKTFESKHPDYLEIGDSSDFQDWVTKSQYRVRMFVRANAMDLDAADELLTMWKDFQKVKAASETTKAVEEKRKRDLKAASGETSTTGESRKKTYSRVELMRLRVNDPDKYNSMQQEIIDAYREGRVK